MRSILERAGRHELRYLPAEQTSERRRRTHLHQQMFADGESKYSASIAVGNA